MFSRAARAVHTPIRRCASTLVVAEHTADKVSQNSLAAISAAAKLGQDIAVLVAGDDCRQAAENAASIEGVNRVLLANDKALSHGLAENMAKAIVSVVKSEDFSHVIVPSSNFGKNYLPRVAAELDVAAVSDVVEIVNDKTFVRPMYAGNALATVEHSDDIKLLSVRAPAFDKAATSDASVAIEDVQLDGADTGLSTFQSEAVSASERPDLTVAPVVVAGGRGMKNGENFAMLEKLADQLGGAVGASRAAVDAGFVPNEYQVGQTGKVVAPNLYIAVGISGAIQHLSGMKDSKTIVAINKDEEAPIFQVADYGLVDDLFKAVPEISDKL